MIIRRGMGDIFGPTRTQLGLPESSAPGYVFGSLQDQMQTCVDTGGTAADCLTALMQTSGGGGTGTTRTGPSAMPAWLIPAGIGLLGFVLLMGIAARR